MVPPTTMNPSPVLVSDGPETTALGGRTSKAGGCDPVPTGASTVAEFGFVVLLDAPAVAELGFVVPLDVPAVAELRFVVPEPEDGVVVDGGTTTVEEGGSTVRVDDRTAPVTESTPGLVEATVVTELGGGLTEVVDESTGSDADAPVFDGAVTDMTGSVSPVMPAFVAECATPAASVVHPGRRAAVGGEPAVV